ncbi:hypothetical protein DID88_000351 [Monilinia fructigena]|uniref:Spindle pole body component n=1 Tax=Monilinia fructigena TaxID=38457 RepID=A0A395IMV8_9HELO|nr:hypothetical protein DID88_000351 [Monilinia fructigena]
MDDEKIQGMLQPNSLFSEFKLPVIDYKLPDVAEQCRYDDLFFGIPELPLGPAAPIDPTPVKSDKNSGDTSCNELAGREEDGDFDIWMIQEQEPYQEPVNYQSWDSFTIEDYHEPQTAYLTEAGPRVFDTALAAEEDSLKVGNNLHDVVDSKVFATSVLALGLGRNSMFFTWDAQKRSFIPTLQKFRVSGYTAQSLGRFLAQFMSVEILPDFFKTLLVSKTLPKKNDEAILSTLFEEIQLLEHKTDALRDILLEILSRTSTPWLEFTSQWLGLQREVGLPLTKEGPGKSFVKVDNKEWVDEAGLELSEPDFTLDHEKIPSFIPLEDARAMFEVGRSLRVLWTHHVDHPLSRMEVLDSVKPPTLEWRYSWQDILDIETKALKYEQDITNALHTFSASPSPVGTIATEFRYELHNFDLDFFGKPEAQMQSHVIASINQLDSKLEEPLVAELESAERQKGVALSAGSMGLRLGGRDTWPPASSELRLALMGVLTESYTSNKSLDLSRASGYLQRQGSLPGDLSFAVRDMSEEEIEKCMDPNSIEALDFLRLSYKPPAPLESILTPIILYKYDQLFKTTTSNSQNALCLYQPFFMTSQIEHLLGKLLIPTAQKFRIEAHHFISSVCGYFFDTGIASTWHIFETKLNEIEERMNSESFSLGQNEGLDKLRDYHERVLDKMLFALLL